MDEEIIEQLMYLIIIIIIVVFYIVRGGKKAQQKTVTKTQSKPRKHQTSTSQTKSKTSPVTERSQKSKVPSMSREIENTLEQIVTEEANLEELVSDEIYEDETLVEHRVISKRKKFDQMSESVDEQPLVITTEDLKKAVILSDIVQPKYF